MKFPSSMFITKGGVCYLVSIGVSPHAVSTDNVSEAITGVLVIVIHDWLTKL